MIFLKSITKYTFAILLLASFFTIPVYGQYLDSTNFSIENPTTIIEGGESSSSSFKYISGSGQLTSGESSSTSFQSLSGALYYPLATTPVIIATAGNASVFVNWTSSVGTFGNVTSYSVGISSSFSGTYTYTNVGTSLNNNFSGLTNGVTYYFKVQTYIAGLPVSESAVVSATPTGSGAGGGGGGGGAPTIPPTTGVGSSVVNFSGRAYPSSKVVVLRNGVNFVTTISDPTASFSISARNLSEGEQIFTIYGEDSDGRRSAPFTFPLLVGANSTINIAGIFLSPTIDVDKASVKQGENIAIFGRSVPESSITISVHSEKEHFNVVKTDKQGVYLLNFDTAVLEIGDHLAKSKSSVATEISPFGNSVAFKVGTETKKKEPKDCANIKSDLNCDGRVNLVDFSIMAYWYKRKNPPANIDLNNDGNITLIDFSILAYNWTG